MCIYNNQYYRTGSHTLLFKHIYLLTIHANCSERMQLPIYALVLNFCFYMSYSYLTFIQIVPACEHTCMQRCVRWTNAFRHMHACIHACARPHVHHRQACHKLRPDITSKSGLGHFVFAVVAPTLFRVSGVYDEYSASYTFTCLRWWSSGRSGRFIMKIVCRNFENVPISISQYCIITLEQQIVIKSIIIKLFVTPFLVEKIFPLLLTPAVFIVEHVCGINQSTSMVYAHTIASNAPECFPCAIRRYKHDVRWTGSEGSSSSS